MLYILNNLQSKFPLSKYTHTFFNQICISRLQRSIIYLNSMQLTHDSRSESQRPISQCYQYLQVGNEPEQIQLLANDVKFQQNCIQQFYPHHIYNQLQDQQIYPANYDQQNCKGIRTKSSRQHYQNLKPLYPNPQTYSNLPLPCQDCTSDCYDEEQIEIINFLMTRATPSRILQVNDMGKKYKLTNNLRIRSAKYSIKKCVHGSLHLFNGVLQVPMMQITLKMLDQAHLVGHGDYSQTSKNLSVYKLRVDVRVFRKYLFKYLQNCRQCKRKKTIFRMPQMSRYKTDIFESINRIPELRKLMVYQKTCVKGSIIPVTNCAKPMFDLRNCGHDCANDYYEKRFQDFLDFIVTGGYPDDLNSLQKHIKAKKKQVLRVVSTKYRVFKCDKKVPHLWRIPNKNILGCFQQPQKVGYMRIPMLKQFGYIASKLHNQFGHHSVAGFTEMMKQTGYDKTTIRKYFYAGLDICSKCEKEKQQNPVIRKYQHTRNNANNNLYNGHQVFQRVDFQQFKQRHSDIVEFNKKYKYQIQNENDDGQEQALNRQDIQQFQLYQTNKQVMQLKKESLSQHSSNNYIEKLSNMKSRDKNCKQKNKLEAKKKVPQFFSESRCGYEYYQVQNQDKQLNNIDLNDYRVFQYNKGKKQQENTPNFMINEQNIKFENNKYKQQQHQDVRDQCEKSYNIFEATQDQPKPFLVLDAQLQQKLQFLKDCKFEVILDNLQIKHKIFSKALLINQTMLSKMKTLGQQIYFTKISGLCQSNVLVHFLLGFDQSAQYILLGVFICVNKSTVLPEAGLFQDYYFAFDQYLKVCKKHNCVPYSIKTDYNCLQAFKAVSSIIYYDEDLRIKQINHHFSCQSYLGYLRAQILDSKQYIQIDQMLISMLNSYEKTELQKTLNYINKYVCRSKLDIIVSQIDKVCPALCMPTFSIGKLQWQSLKKFKQIINSKLIVKGLSFLQMLSYFTRLQKKLETAINEHMQNLQLNKRFYKFLIQKNPEIKHGLNAQFLEGKVESLIANQIIKLSEKAVQLKLIRKNDTKFQTIDLQDNRNIVNYDCKYSHWICECRRIYIEGIPCQHILRVAIFEFHGDIAYYLNSRWTKY